MRRLRVCRPMANSCRQHSRTAGERRARADAEQLQGIEALGPIGHVLLARLSVERPLRRVHSIAARRTRGRRCCIAPLLDYFESHDLRCSSKKARTCSGSSAPRNSTPAGSGSGLKTLSGVGIFGGLASMIFLLYKPIICLGPCFAPVSNAADMFFVALTAQAGNATRNLNRIYQLTAMQRFLFLAGQHSRLFLTRPLPTHPVGLSARQPCQSHEADHKRQYESIRRILCSAASA